MGGKVLILGGTGFIGRNLCRYLVERDYSVTCLSRNVERTLCDGVEYIRGDFFDDGLMEKLADGKDYIIHAISSLNPGNSNEKYMDGYELDFIHTVRLCKRLVNTDTKLIFISSGGTVYGNHYKQPIDENVLPRPINHYGNVKLCIENTLRAFNYQMHNRMLIVRIANPYGPGQDFTRGVGFIDAALKNTINGQPITIWGDGENVRDYIYIDDVCGMIFKLLEYNGENDTFNISTGVGTSQNEIVEILRCIGLEPRVVYVESRSVDVNRIILDNSRILDVVNKQPMRLEDGVSIYRDYLLKRYKSQ
jgi:UDP-glucose 4-epimerase